MRYTLDRHRTDKYSKEKLLNELERVAAHFNYVQFGKRDFNKVAGISHNPVVKEFGSWQKAIATLREHLNSKAIELKPKRRVFISDQDLFAEMDRIWTSLQHRPSRNEWESQNPKYSLQPYKTRFDGWRNACLRFIEHKMGKEITAGARQADRPLQSDEANGKETSPRSARTVPLKVRLAVLSRDKFKCVYCGRSPATHPGVSLHIDHITPFSKGGKTTIDNLQTLCFDCNLGKSNQENIGYSDE